MERCEVRLGREIPDDTYGKFITLKEMKEINWDKEADLESYILEEDPDEHERELEKMLREMFKVLPD